MARSSQDLQEPKILMLDEDGNLHYPLYEDGPFNTSSSVSLEAARDWFPVFIKDMVLFDGKSFLEKKNGAWTVIPSGMKSWPSVVKISVLSDVRSSPSSMVREARKNRASFIKDKDWRVRFFMASDYSTSVPQLMAMLKDKHEKVRSAIFEHGKMLADKKRRAILEKLVSDPSPLVREALARHDWISEETKMKLVKDDDENVFRHLAGGNKISLNLANALLEHDNTSVNKILARNKKTPKSILVKLWKMDESPVRQLAGNRSTPPSVLEEIAKEQAAGIADPEISKSLASNPSSPVHVIASFEKEYPEQVARNEGASTDVINRLSRHQDSSVYLEAIENQKLSPSLLNRFARSTDDEIRLAASYNKSLSDDIIRLLAADTYDEVRESIAMHGSTPVDVLKSLAKDSSHIVSDVARRHLSKKMRHGAK